MLLKMLRLFDAKIIVKYLAAPAILVFCLVWPRLAPAELIGQRHVELAYDVYLGGFLAGSVDLTVDHADGRYEIAATSRSHGLLDFLIEFRRRNKTTGKLIEQQAKPANYDAEGVWAGRTRSVQIEYGAGDRLRFTARPNAAEDEREAVPARLLPGTVDPLSALYMAVLRTGERDGCNGKSKIFDGRRRYDLRFETIGDGKAEGPFYSGLARVCRMRQIPIAGFSQKTWLPRLVRPEWTDIWLAKPGDNMPAVPVRLQADAGLGDMVAHLVAVGGRKQPPGNLRPADAVPDPAADDSLQDPLRRQ
ncbi:MAG: DUF3108 domain-containing protein [Alphaproteobacteria bacterium]|nr:DUF3108 domain-containing protein [Alphaproteobacteria bacterium]